MTKEQLNTWFNRIQSACLLLLAVMALLYYFGPKAAGQTPPAPPVAAADMSEDAVLHFATKIRAVTPENIMKKYVATDGKPTLMVFYASWCGYCKQLMPVLADMHKTGEMGNAHFQPISTDEDKLNLAPYILEHNYVGVFEPVVIDRSATKSMVDVLSAKGSYFNGVIPYTLVFNGHGKLVAELRGVVNKGRILDALADARKS